MSDLQVYGNPYDPNTQDFEPQTKPLDAIIRNAITAAGLERFNVWRPAKVTAKKGSQKVDLQILFQRMYVDGDAPVTLPEIQDVMVVMPSGQNYSIRLPVSVGDTGIALFCDRSLDKWSVSGGTLDPVDTRTHAITDAVFIPGLYPFSTQIDDGTSTDLILTNGDSQVFIETNGKFKIKNKSNEMFDVMDQVLANIDSLYDTLANQAFTMTLLGPQPFIASTVTLLTNLRTSFDQLKTKWETLKG